MPDIISIGEGMVELFADEPLDKASVFHRAYGGDTLNLLVAASRLGSATGYITRVGQDPFAPYLLASWAAEGIDTSQVKLVEGFNGLYFISLLPEGEREFTYYRRGSAASTLEPQDLDADYIGDARILHLSGITQALSPSCRAATLAAAQIARQRGVKVSYDPNLRLRLWRLEEAQAAVAELLPLVDIMLSSAPEEAELLFGIAAPEALAEHLLVRSVGTVAIKAGPEGCWIATREEVVHLSAAAPKGVVDTTGAGDAFNGGFLHGLCRGLDAVEAAGWGLAVAGLKLGGRGAVASLPTRAEVERFFPNLRD